MPLTLEPGCSHTASDMDIAANADGLCPLCLNVENQRLLRCIASIEDELTRDPPRVGDALFVCEAARARSKANIAEENMSIETESHEFIGWYAGHHDRDAEVTVLKAEVTALRTTLEGIAEYCSTDHGTLSAIARLASIRNTAERALCVSGQSPQPEK